jgi:transcriptional regulator with XRE-family HTH domain
VGLVIDMRMNPRSRTLITFGRVLRAFRESAGITQERFADDIHYSKAWMSNLETGQIAPPVDRIPVMEKLLNIPPNVLMYIREQYDDERQQGEARPWDEEEQRATALRTFQISLIPELLQTENYARALFPADEEVMRRILDRQAILTRQDPAPPTLYCVLDEAVLRWPRVDGEVMREQLEHLIASAAPPQVTIQIIPSDRDHEPRGAFTIATVDGTDVALIDTAIRSLVTANRDDTATLKATWESIRTFALSHQESIARIQQAIEERQT